MSLSLDASASRSPAAHFDSASPPEANDTTNVAALAADASSHTGSGALNWNAQLAGVIKTALAANSPVGPGTAGGTSFDAQVRGTQPKAIDQQLAELCKDVGTLPAAGSAPKNIDGWSRLDDSQLRAAGIDPASLEDPSTGFRAAVYQNAQGQHVLAFAGSNDSKDWLDNNIPQGLGLPAAQYDQAAALATKAKEAFGDSLVVTGHSLGGGLASVAALATNSAAVTFNAAGVSDNTLHRIIPDTDVSTLKNEANDGLIRRYAVKGDVLTGEQETGALNGALPNALGHKITLNDPNPLPWYEEAPGANLIFDSTHGLQLHGIDSVLSALQKDHPWTPGGNQESVVDKISDVIGKGTNGINSALDWGKNHLKDAIKDGTNKIADALGHVPLVGGLLKGLTHGLGSVGSAVVSVGGDALEGLIGVSGHVLQGYDKFIGKPLTSLVNGTKDVVKDTGHVLSKALPWNW